MRAVPAVLLFLASFLVGSSHGAGHRGRVSHHGWDVTGPVPADENLSVTLWLRHSDGGDTADAAFRDASSGGAVYPSPESLRVRARELLEDTLLGGDGGRVGSASKAAARGQSGAGARGAAVRPPSTREGLSTAGSTERLSSSSSSSSPSASFGDSYDYDVDGDEDLRARRRVLGGPSREALGAVLRWVTSSVPAGRGSWDVGPDWITVSADAGSVASLLGLGESVGCGASTPLCLAWHEHRDSRARRAATVTGAGHRLPDSVEPHVVLVTGVHELVPGPARRGGARGPWRREDVLVSSRAAAPKFNATPVTDDPGLTYLLTPDAVRSMYGVPPGARLPLPHEVTGSPDAPLGIVSFGSMFDPASQRSFAEAVGVSPRANVTTVNAGPDGSGLAESADVSVQFGGAVSRASGVAFWSYAEHGGHFWLLDWARDLDARFKAHGSLPSVALFAHAQPSELPCDTTDPNCVRLGAELDGYIEVSETKLAHLGALGVTVVASSGLDGAMGGSRKCPSRFHDTCSSFHVIDAANSTVCTLPAPETGLDPACRQLLERADCRSAIESFARGGAGAPCDLSIDMETYEMRAACQCRDLDARSWKGTCVAAPDTPQTWQYFTAGYPASSPRVLSVGTTRLTRWTNPACRIAGTDEIDALRQGQGEGSQGGAAADGEDAGELPGPLVCEWGEIAATTDSGCNVTSGGGFANAGRHRSLRAPAYQVPHIDAYVSRGGAPPHGSFDRTARGFPDVSALGVNCLVSRGGAIGPASDSSCATAVVAGIVSVLSEKSRLRTGKPLGPVTERFYAAAGGSSGAFFDVVGGNNTCSRRDCCLFGYEATPGWDPVTGLGSIRYPGLYRALFPQDFNLPGFSSAPGVGGPAAYASRDSLPWIVLPLIVIGFLFSAFCIIVGTRKVLAKTRSELRGGGVKE